MPTVGTVVQVKTRHRSTSIDGTAGGTFTTGETKPGIVIKDNTTTSDVAVLEDGHPVRILKNVANADLV